MFKKLKNKNLTLMKTTKQVVSLLILALVLLLGSNQNIAQNVGIGAESFTPDPSAGLEVKFSDKGFLPPRMTTEERDEIQNPAEGLVIFNTTTKCLNYRVGNFWYDLCGNCTPHPIAPSAGSHLPSATQIVWNWNSVGGVDGYKYNIVNDYATATDNGTSTTYILENLDCETGYNFYVWAYNNCGHSEVLSITQTTTECPFVCGTSTVTFTYKGNPVTYGTVLSSGKCWHDRNLGASQVASNSTDPLAYGDLFQWGRRIDGHEYRTSLTTETLSNTDQPAHNSFIIVNSGNYDWRSPQNADLWQGVGGINNPCPAGWRIPIEAEWEAERLSWAPDNNETGAINSPLKLLLTGARAWHGALYDMGSSGNYWSSSVDDTYSKNLGFGSWGAGIGSNARAFGFSVRCIKD